MSQIFPPTVGSPSGAPEPSTVTPIQTPGSFVVVSTNDPGAVGAGKVWVDTSSGPPFQLRVRDSDNLTWQDVGAITPDELTADELAAIQGANSPSAANVFATMADVADELTADELAAIQGANSPSAANVFATMDDLDAVTDLTSDDTVIAVAAPNTTALVSRTVSLPAGVYLVLASCMCSNANNTADNGTLLVRKGGAQIGDDGWIRRQSATFSDVRNWLVGTFTHAGGSVTVDMAFNAVSGTLTFGVSMDGRFGRTLQICRIGS